MRSTVSRGRGETVRQKAVRVGVTAVVAGLFAGLLLVLEPLGVYGFDWRRIWGPGGYRDLLLTGLLWTALVSALGMVVGLLLGLAGGLARLSPRVALQQIGTLYVELVRGTPLLVQILVAYYFVAPVLQGLLVRAGLPLGLASWVQQPVVVGVAALGTCAGAYVTEIVRAAIESVDPGQTEAALAQGMTRRQVFRLVLLPQALRRMVPPLTGELVTLVKDSSLLMVIAVPEVMKRAYEAASATYRSFEVYLPLALLYLCITFPLSRLSRRLERHLA